MKKVLIIMLAHNAYNHLVDSVKQTWCKNLPENYKLILNYGNGNKNYTYQIEDRVYSPFQENQSNIISKTFDIFNFVKDWNFDYILRCCCGTYINLNILNQIIEILPSSNCYWGLPLKYEDVNYATGSCYLISKDLIPVILKNKNICKTIIDDVNASYNIIRKVFPNAFSVDEIAGVGLHPVSIKLLQRGVLKNVNKS